MHSKPYFMNKDKWQKLIGIFALAILLFNFPLINLFSGTGWIFSLPALYVYIFFCWALIILLTYWVSSPPKNKGSKDKDLQKGRQP
jgi:hypothetical protein